jgi:hypothetical protein
MTIKDGYDAYYATKIWNLIPAVYREEDSDSPDVSGPLHEMAARIGAQAAILRRSIDRLWEDQSIETCDDWVIPYIGDLLATNLVPSLDGRGRRVDVAKTIHYRRGAGTLVILEEVAHDITGWEVRVVEFFRRLLRTRHLLDPAIGVISSDKPPTGDTLLQTAEELVGAFTATPLGGFADLRKPYGAANTGTAFDEYAHMADFRLGRGRTGWHEIQKVGAFVWRLRSYGVTLATPVRCGTSDLYTFDPTGRMVQLFALASRTSPASYGDAWSPAEEWQLPGPISTLLYSNQQANLYPRSVQVLHKPGSFYDLIDPSAVTVHSELGTFKVTPATPAGEELGVSSYYGFSSEIGAGPFDRRRVVEPSPQEPPITIVHGGHNLNPGSSGTWTIADSRTYDRVSDPNAKISDVLTINCLNQQRPLIRLSAGWTFEGDGGSLYLEGLFISGADVVLTGEFDVVRLACCTLDPGTLNVASGATTILAESVDGRPLSPTRLLIEGDIRSLELDHCILGPIRDRTVVAIAPTAHIGAVESVTVTDSILQGIRTAGTGVFVTSELQDPLVLLSRLHAHTDPLATFVWNQLSATTQQIVSDYLQPAASPPSLSSVENAVLGDINMLLQGGSSIYDSDRFRWVVLDPETQRLVASPPAGADLTRFNRVLLEEAFPGALADLALMITNGEVDLTRCTVLGPAYVHRLSASESILDDMFVIEDLQHGCVRFSAWSSGSALPRQYESVEIAPHAPIFTSREFGDPGYCQLRSNADMAILSGGPRATIYEGGPSGSEMGAFAREMNAIKERSLLLKYQEFMPLGLTPVVIDVT